MIPEQRAVEFDQSVDMGMGYNKCFPFFYSFVNSEDDTWEENKATNYLDSIGPLVPAGGTIEHAIRLNPDYNFKMLWIKYSAYHDASGTALWYEPQLVGPSLMDIDFQTQIGTPLFNSLRISVSAHGPDGRYLYGGKNIENHINLQGDLLSMNPHTLQGYDYGWGQVRSEYLLPREGIIKLLITNTHEIKDLYVAGIVFGMKVRL